MKKIRVYVILLVALLLGIGLWFMLGTEPSAENDSELQDNAQDISSGEEKTNDKKEPKKSELPPPLGSISQVVDDPTKLIEKAYNTEISFYGLVLDTEDEPIKDARVTIVVDNKPWGGGIKHQLTTDKEGRFSINDERGVSLSASAEKEGYYQIKESDEGGSSGYFIYASITGTPLAKSGRESSKPAILRLRKKNLVTELIRGKQDWVVPSDGTVISLPLVEGDRTYDMQIVFVKERDTDSGPVGWPWKVTLLVKGGGILERTEKLDFEAPEQGYKSSDFVYDMTHYPDGIGWSHLMRKDFFLKFSNDHYARVNVGFYASSGRVIVDYCVNNTGSRNLE